MVVQNDDCYQLVNNQLYTNKKWLAYVYVHA